MKLNIASDFFERLKVNNNNKSEVKIYDNFIGILFNLSQRNLADEELQGIEEKLDLLELESNPKNRKNYFRKSLSEFKKYLKEKLNLVTEGYFTAIGIALGVSFGAAFGSLFGFGTSIGIGLMLGLIIGAIKDSEAKNQNRVLLVKM